MFYWRFNKVDMSKANITPNLIENDKSAIIRDNNGNVNCPRCYNCYNCSNCIDCINCSNCSNCKMSYNIKDSKQCEKCFDCSNCNECTLCRKCEHCTSCYHLFDNIFKINNAEYDKV